jgi:hypothetical protein
MVRVGYPTCVACHLSPQGRGLLTDYGKGIDEAESLRGGVYEPPPEQRRLLHDVRLQLQANETGGTAPATAQARFWYRNATFLTRRSRVGLTLSAGVPYAGGLEAGRPVFSPSPSMPVLFVSRAMWEYRPRENVEIAIGRDALPSGLEIADQASFIRQYNHQGVADVPTQAKLFWWTKRTMVTPYVFGPSGHERPGHGSRGGGVNAELIAARDHVVVGVSARQSSSDVFDDRLLGGYVRAGFGRWGILAEHDITRRTRQPDPFNRYTGYSQVFFYPTRWILASLALEQLQVDAPYAERKFRLRPGVSLRLTSEATVAFSMRDQWSADGPRGTTYSVQLFLKTVQ